MKRFSRNISLLVMSLLLVTGLIEVFLRLFLPQIYEVHAPGMYNLDPEIGYVLTPGFSGTIRRAEFEFSFHTGPNGLRGARLRARQPQTVRILLLGDSQIFGFGVEDTETVAAQLSALLQLHYPEGDFQVLNGGVPGYGTADELAWLKSRGPQIGPDVVVLQFLPVNDFEENRAPAREWAGLREGMLVAQTTNGEDPPAWRRIQHWLKGNLHLARLLSDRLGYLLMKAGILGDMAGFWGEDFTAADAERLAVLFREFSRVCQQLGAEGVVLYTCGQGQIISDATDPLRSRPIVESAAEQAGLRWIDTVPKLRRRPDRRQLYYPLDGHWTARGHRAVAEILMEYFQEWELGTAKIAG